MKKLLLILVLVWVMLVTICSGSDLEYFIDPSTTICFAVFSGNFTTNTHVPCDKIPLHRLKVLKESGWSSFREMTPDEKKLYHNRIREKYGSVTE